MTFTYCIQLDLASFGYLSLYPRSCFSATVFYHLTTPFKQQLVNNFCSACNSHLAQQWYLFKVVWNAQNLNELWLHPSTFIMDEILILFPTPIRDDGASFCLPTPSPSSV